LPSKVVITQGLKFHIEPVKDSLETDPSMEQHTRFEEDVKQEERETRTKTDEDISLEEEANEFRARRSLPNSISNSMILERNNTTEELNMNPLRNSMISTGSNKKFKLHLKVKKGQNMQGANISEILKTQLKKSGVDSNTNKNSFVNANTNLKTSSYITVNHIEEHNDKTNSNKNKTSVSNGEKEGGGVNGQESPNTLPGSGAHEEHSSME